MAASPPTPNKANISIREYIYFLPYPLPPGTPVPYTPGLPKTNPLHLPPHPFEPTSTLVLTSPRGTFVDLRFLKPVKEGESELPNTGGPWARLEWGFAGWSESVPIEKPSAGASAAKGDEGNDDGEEQGQEQKEEEEEDSEDDRCYESVSHSTWHHWIDSRHAVGAPNIPVDEGDMYTLSDELSLEHGHAFHPHLNAVKSHEELWKDVEIMCVPSASASLVSPPPADKKTCVVLRCENTPAKVRGVIVRLGQFCQGILMMDGNCTVERWEYDIVQGAETASSDGSDATEIQKAGADEKENGNWKRTARIGDLFLPCAVTFKPDILVPTSPINFHDYHWKVDELWEWKD